MPNYADYVRMLRFVASKTAVDDDQQAQELMQILNHAAVQLEKEPALDVDYDKIALTSRAFGGVARFLSQRILPEAEHHGNEEALAQVRWSIELSMKICTELMVFQRSDAEAIENGEEAQAPLAQSYRLRLEDPMDKPLN